MYWDSVYLIWQESYTHEISVVWFPKQDIDINITRWYVKMDGRKSHMPQPLEEDL